MTHRCAWAKRELDIAYHDAEWGVPVHDDRRLFEFLVLEGAQAGLSWSTVLKKREHYREVFDQFEIARVAAYDAEKVAALLADPGIIRNRLKVQAAINNARAALDVQAKYGSLDAFLWQFVQGKPQINYWRNMADVPASTAVSEYMSKVLQQHGFKFVGSTICYAFMQATGMVNDHILDCFRHAELLTT
ncbi:DNA-3-methyladenine glycosylase I [Methylobacillus rhizosphaerae]|uniref:DNA-3-methyladenine glycosylase I n=1 Tax=Methylobacillus rhizosphaerae TaxID=551994 RepID=A0A238ZY54_9PROT|nr:DNA-3-methyladenine glycosylase I [Methylobacillus rhizosphaerae]SNR88317.1 DNA-3-methyladenine glycosylase I [Methylobacillus rhizosphaerae]